MQTYGQYNIVEVPLGAPFFRSRVEKFLTGNGLRLEDLDVYCTLQNADGDILAGGGLHKDIIKCIAVDGRFRSEGLVAPLVSHLISLAAARGIPELKLFTKPENLAIFESLGFHLLASAPKAILMEKGRGLERYCQYLGASVRPGRSGVIVMNANPFTLGHQYLIEKALEQVDNLFIIPVKEDLSLFPYAERLAMIKKASAKAGGIGEIIFPGGTGKTNFPEAIANPTHADASVIVLEGSDYCISAATFPTYFLKDLSDAAETQMRLDLDLYSRWIAPALGASVRFVGTEPYDALTSRYNAIMKEVLPCVVELPRLEGISASGVRKALAEGSFAQASAKCPETTWPYLLAVLAERALRLELDTPLKPGLVCPDSRGAHRDMDYTLMLKGIAAIRPFFPQMAVAASADELRQLGLDAERAMMAATGGVNTHRGAIFALGLALNAAGTLMGREMETAQYEEDMQRCLGEIAQALFDKQLKDCQLHFTLVGARRLAASGYHELIEDWLPYYRSMQREEVFSSAKKNADATDETSSLLQNTDAIEKTQNASLQATLLRIMSTLDDTCVLKRVGPERAEAVKREAASLLESFSEDKLKDLCDRYAAEGISPGGAADMLALTIFIHSIIL